MIKEPLTCYLIGTDESIVVFGLPRTNYDNIACHAMLDYSREFSSIKDIYEVVTNTLVKFENEEGRDYNLVKKYYEWLFKESPFRKYIKSTSVVGHYINSIRMVTHGDTPSNMLFICHVSFRYPWEHLPFLRVWDLLVNEGYNKDFAFILSHFIRYTSGEYYYHPLTTHNCVNINLNLECIESFIKGNFKETKPFNVTRRYTGIYDSQKRILPTEYCKGNHDSSFRNMLEPLFKEPTSTHDTYKWGMTPYKRYKRRELLSLLEKLFEFCPPLNQYRS